MPRLKKFTAGCSVAVHEKQLSHMISDYNFFAYLSLFGFDYLLEMIGDQLDVQKNKYNDN